MMLVASPAVYQHLGLVERRELLARQELFQIMANVLQYEDDFRLLVAGLEHLQGNWEGKKPPRKAP